MAAPPAKDKKRPSFQELLSQVLSWQQLYVLASALLVLGGARIFYSSLRMQTEHVSLWFAPEQTADVFAGIRHSLWSAPLDDVFIHFDFAKSTASGAPFEWIAGNGYSSGGTSLLYPFVLAFGYRLGFVELQLFQWAGIVACVGTFATLLGARRLFKKLPEWTALIGPPAFLCVGALNWTLYSGMEVAMFLALWALCLVVWDDLLEAILAGTATRLHALTLGLCCALLVAGRPEASPLVAIFGFWCAGALWSRHKRGASIWTLLLIGTPGAIVMIAHMAANKYFTGDSAAAGALAKLEMHHPYLTGEQVWNSWIHFLKYQFLRLSDYHFSAWKYGWLTTGYLLWPLAILSVVFKKTRRYGALLLLSATIWIALTALNGQVRWQNERYTMPAVAWLLLAAALGIAGCVDWATSRERSRVAGWATVIPIIAAIALFVGGQAERYRDQVWFFGRASRNILEQHVRAATYISEVKPRRKRILLSDAGALPYIARLPAFDLIGLGGYEGLPIAGASRQGVGAAVELIEYLPRRERPDIMALYPGWWGDFVLWFGRRVNEFPVRGNVICGGASKVIYAPQWSPIDHSDAPISILPTERIVDEVDVADVISEKAHQLSWNREAQGYVGMKILPDPRNPKKDLWDASRLIATMMELKFKAQAPSTGEGHLLARVAPAQPVKLELHVDGKLIETIEIEADDKWQEVRIPFTSTKRSETLDFMIRPVEGEVHIHHLFLVEDDGSGQSAK